jgi:hypothetical protein
VDLNYHADIAVVLLAVARIRDPNKTLDFITMQKANTRLEPGETVVLQFNPEKIKHVEGQFAHVYSKA